MAGGAPVPLAIDASSPATATNTVGTATTVTSASFTPPVNAIVLVRWAGNSTGAPASPTISDTAGSTWTLVAWQSIADAPNRNGQAAIWWTRVTAATSRTVSVVNNASSGFRASAARITVITGTDLVTPIGASGKAGSASASSIAQSYTAQRSGSQGYISVCDWDTTGAETAGTGCSLDAAGSLTTDISYGMVRRTAADGVQGVSSTLNVTIPATSTALNWVYAEVLPGTSAPRIVVANTPRRRAGGVAIVTQNTTAQAAAPQAALPVPLIVDAPRPRLPGVALVSQTRDVTPLQPSDNPALPVVVDPPAPPRPGRAVVTATAAADEPPAPPTVVVDQPQQPRPGRILVTASSAEQAAVDAPPGPAPVVVDAPRLRAPGVALVLQARDVTPLPPSDSPPAPVVVARATAPRSGFALATETLAEQLVVESSPPTVVVAVPTVRRSGVALAVQPESADEPPPPRALVVAAAHRPRGGVALLQRSQDIVVAAGAARPGITVVAAPARRRAGIALVLQVIEAPDHECFVYRPNTGQILHGGGVVTRPATGTVAHGGAVIVRPYTGIVENEC